MKTLLLRLAQLKESFTIHAPTRLGNAMGVASNTTEQDVIYLDKNDRAELVGGELKVTRVVGH